MHVRMYTNLTCPMGQEAEGNDEGMQADDIRDMTHNDEGMQADDIRDMTHNDEGMQAGHA
jgi:hypothetical protein